MNNPRASTAIIPCPPVASGEPFAEIPTLRRSNRLVSAGRRYLQLAGIAACAAAALQAAPLLTPGDPIFGYDTDTAGGNTGGTNFPAVSINTGQEANKAIDGNTTTTKYLNFGKYSTGIIVTPSAAAIAKSMVLTTGGDAIERDPTSYILLGSNQPITSANASNGFADQWEYIAQGTLSLPTTRLAPSTVNFTNIKSYSSYWLVFPTLRNITSANSMQIEEIQFYTEANAGGTAIFAPENAAVGTGWNNNPHGTEVVARVIDGNPSTKYLNFGENNCGFWVVPSVGPSIVTSFQLTTANDSPDRDPMGWKLEGFALDGVNAGKWFQIGNGADLALPAARGTAGSVVDVSSNTTKCTEYRMTFTTVKNAAGANSMQVAEAQFFGTIVPRKDTDNDLMDDDWETQYGLIVGVDDSAGDLDSDGSTNLQEYQRGTLPNNNDTDGDGLYDGVETKTGVFVSTSDAGTDPLNPDSDADTYVDGYEVVHGTNPNVAGSIPTITWDITPGTVGAGDSLVSGGTGTWDLATGNWTTDSGANNVAWDNNGARVVAVFGDLAGTVTISGGIGADRVIVNTDGYVLTGDALTLSGTAPRINVATGTCEMAQVLAGTAGFTKLGNGILKLTGDSNTYSGTTKLGGIGKLLLAKNPGEIAIPGDIYLDSTAFNGNNSGVVLGGDEQIADSAVLTWSGLADTYYRLNGHTETIGGLVSVNDGRFAVIENRGLNDTADYPTGTLIINTTGSNSYSYNGNIRNVDGGTLGGTIAVTKTGTGTQILSGNMSFSGATTVNDGMLVVNSTMNNSPVTVTGTGTLAGTGTLGPVANVLSGGTITPGIAGVGTLSSTNGVVLGTGGTLAGSGTLNGAVTVGDGAMLIGGGSVTGAVTVQSGGSVTGSPTLGGAVTIQSGGSLAGTATCSNTLTLQAGSTLSPGGTALGTITATGTVSLAGDATFTINKTGATLSADMLAGFSAITYGGTLTIDATGDALALGEAFQLFAPAGGATISGSFSNIVLPTLPAGLAWEMSNLLTTGEIVVVNYAGTPTFSPPAGGYVGGQSVTITADSGATIYYTTDGSTPTVGSSSGPSPVSGIVVPVNSTTTIKAFATMPGLSNSPVATAVYRTVTIATWNVDDNGLWSETTKWLNEVVPNAIGAPVNFTFAESLDTAVTLDGSRTVGSLTFANPNGYNWSITPSGGSVLTLATDAGTPVIDVQENTATIAAALGGTQGLVKSGGGLLVLSGSNSYGGGTSIDGGVLSVGSFAANGNNSGLGAGSSVSIDGGTLRYTGGSVGNGIFNRMIALGAGGGTLDLAMASGYCFTSGVISGSGDLTKTGIGQLIIQANNTYDGVTYVNEAEIQIRTTDALGSTVGQTVVANGARLCAGGGLIGTVNENLVLSGMGGNTNGALQANDAATTVTYAGNVTLDGDSGIGSNSGTIGFGISGPIGGSGGLIKVSANAVTLSGAVGNTYLGSTTLGGTGKLVLAKTGGVLAIPGDLNLSSTAWNGNSSGVVLGGDEQIADIAILTWTTTAYGGGDQQDSFLRLNGHTETVGGLASGGNGGKAVIENRGLNDVTPYGTGTLIINTVGTGSYSYNGSFRDMDGGTGGGAIALVKAGTGTQILAGNVSCTGTTSVNEGTLVINSNSNASATTVASGATLKGTGTLSGTLTVGAGGSVAPGASAGTLTAGDTIIAGTYTCEVDGASADRLTVNGSLDVTGATLAFDVISAPTAAQYVIASYTTTLTGTFAGSGVPAGYTVQYDGDAKQIKLVSAGFGGWATSKGLSGDPAADFDADGLSDAVEYVLGTDPTAASADGPVATSSGGDFVVTFNRDHASMTADVAVDIEVGTDLANWPGVYHVGADTGSSTTGVTVADQGSYDVITLTIPRGTTPARYARMRVTVTP